ncbi:MAG TPA: diacylglycerol kinase family protein [Terriglobia bacterium]|nr:diacylglycerol kinase family protein [Terriglobia bacterium]
MNNAILIYNPVAGRRPARREKEIRQAAALLEDSGVRVTLARTSGPGDACELARDAASQGARMVLVCGGDGTINEVINGLAPGETTLGILPGGTANIIAKELGLPHDPVRGARQLPHWRPRRIPLGLAAWSADATGGANPRNAAGVEHRYFMSVAGVGFDAYVVHRLSSRFKMSWGVIAYGLEAVRQALRHSFPVFNCQLDGRTLAATFAVIQRTRVYAGWLHLAPRARFFEPEFQVCAFKSRSYARYFLYAGAVFARRHLRLRDVELVVAPKVACSAAVPGSRIHFELDGEHVAELPATFEIVPEALTLLVP